MFPTKSHWLLFAKWRETRRENIIEETNKLLVRLDKLIREAPQDPKDQKLHEQNVVKWVEDDYVKLCPQCAKNFNLSRRRHHCRLCGSIMCHNCSQFLDPNYANQLVSPIDLSPIDLETSQLNSSASAPEGGKLQRRGSIISLPAIPSSSNEAQVRVCRFCKDLLDRRNQQMYERHSKPLIRQLYERYQANVSEAEKLIKQYYQIFSTLSSGEAASYKIELAHGQEVKIKLMVLTEKIDAISRKIAALGSQGDIPVSETQKRLQNRVRAAAVNFMHNNLSGLPSLPTLEELEQLKKEKLAENSSANPSGSPNGRLVHRRPQSGPVHMGHRKASPTDEGWTPEIKTMTKEEIEDMDPMLVQINQIKEYIRKAREANKYDEAKVLEVNLKELEIELMMKSIPAGSEEDKY